MYIVIEGQDGTGKGTQAKMLADYFESIGKEVAVIEEPDGDLPQAHDLHDLILARGYDLDALTNVLLFTAARVELWRKIAEPMLKKGGVVISTRNYWSTLAYQGYGEGVSRSRIVRLTKEALPEKYCRPDFGFVLTAPDKVRAERQKGRGKAVETFEAKADDFQQRVNAAYPRLAEEFGLIMIDASGTVEEIFEKIKAVLKI